MPDTNQHEIAESQFERNQRREAEVENALKKERARHEAAVNNMYRLRALRLAEMQHQSVSQCPLLILRRSRPAITAREVPDGKSGCPF
jgi:hypothetical protein